VSEALRMQVVVPRGSNDDGAERAPVARNIPGLRTNDEAARAARVSQQPVVV
jgi:hypothetical protein